MERQSSNKVCIFKVMDCQISNQSQTKYEKIMIMITKTQDALSTTFVAILGIILNQTQKY
jgi:hypothetical protein